MSNMEKQMKKYCPLQVNDELCQGSSCVWWIWESVECGECAMVMIAKNIKNAQTKK